MIDIIYRYAMVDVPARPPPADSRAALLRLSEGNREFAALLDKGGGESVHAERIVSVDLRDLGLRAAGAMRPDQHPFAAVLGCSDARVPLELIFGEGPNDLFVVRVAGNTLGTDVLGSLKYAVDHLSGSLKLVVVLGHSGCGALTAAVDVFLDSAEYLPLATKHSLRNIIDGLQVVVQASARRFQRAFGPDISRHPRYRQALIEASIVTNAAMGAYSIQQEIGAGDVTGLLVAYGVYLLETRRIWSPPVREMTGAGLALAPRDKAGFAELGAAVLRSDRIRSLLTPDA